MRNQLIIDHSTPEESYYEFLQRKIVDVERTGFDVELSVFNPALLRDPFRHESACAKWMISGGCRALFASFGLGKTVIQLEVCRVIMAREGGAALIITPLGARQEFYKDWQMLKAEAEQLSIPIKFIRTDDDIEDGVICITNYETVREGKISFSRFTVVSLDEASVLRSFGSKTFGEMLFGAIQQVPYRFVATATPSPNEYQELIAYAAFLGIMDIGQARTRFFKRNSEKADELTLHPHKVEEYWLWVSSWSVWLDKPSDIGFPDTGYSLPEIKVRWHEVRTGDSNAGEEKTGQNRLFRKVAHGLSEAAREKRESITLRVAKTKEIVDAAPEDHFILWHDLEDERKALQKAFPESLAIFGTQDLDEREQRAFDFSQGMFRLLSTKPSIFGSGTNPQYFCHRAVFAGIGPKFNDFIQAIHRLQRFGQQFEVEIDIIYTEQELGQRRILERKWQQHDEQRARMRAIIEKYGLSNAIVQDTLARKMGVNRKVHCGKKFTMVFNDNVLEMPHVDSATVGAIVTSTPFASQYEYSENFCDFGHTDDNQHFFRQMSYLTPHLLRVLKPGRVLAVHVKDRVMPSGMTGSGFMTTYPFHCDVVNHFLWHGFEFLNMATIVTDVVRENNQTYRLGYSEQCKDGSRMGFGMPEYVLVFRKLQTDTSNGYADDPVSRPKDSYSLSRWQIDANGFARSSGNRLLPASEWKDLKWKEIWAKYKEESLSEVYDFERHVAIGDVLDKAGKLPKDFSLIPPQSWHPDVWTDITRMRSLNSSQTRAGRETHLCPLPFDIVKRLIDRYTMPGELVLDPFAGIGTVPLCAIEMGREGLGIELNEYYFEDAVRYCTLAEYKQEVPTLFDFVQEPKDTPKTETNGHSKNGHRKNGRAKKGRAVQA